MATYEIEVKVSYMYTVEADDDEQAEKEGWNYEDYKHFAQVDSIKFDMVDDDENDDAEFLDDEEE
jgi:hypothetical protein